MGSEDTQRPDGQSCATIQKVPNQTNQLQTQIMIQLGYPLLDPTELGNPLLEPTQGSRQVEDKRPVLRRSKHVLFIEKVLHMIERCNPLLKQEHPKHVHLITARASTLKIKRHMKQRGNTLKAVTQMMCQTVPSLQNGATRCKP